MQYVDMHANIRLSNPSQIAFYNVSFWSKISSQKIKLCDVNFNIQSSVWLVASWEFKIVTVEDEKKYWECCASECWLTALISWDDKGGH